MVLVGEWLEAGARGEGLASWFVSKSKPTIVWSLDGVAAGPGMAEYEWDVESLAIAALALLLAALLLRVALRKCCGGRRRRQASA